VNIGATPMCCRCNPPEVVLSAKLAKRWLRRGVFGSLVGVGSWGWARSGGGFDRVLGVLLLELHGTQLTECGV
jgi:hypothetical protein